MGQTKSFIYLRGEDLEVFEVFVGEKYDYESLGIHWDRSQVYSPESGPMNTLDSVGITYDENDHPKVIQVTWTYGIETLSIPANVPVKVLWIRRREDPKKKATKK